MDSMIRETLEEQLGKYILDTLKYIKTVKEFCVENPQWTLEKKNDLQKMTDIKAKAENKNATWGKKIWSSLTNASQRQNLEKELEEVLKDSLEGLKKLYHFLDAVEKLAVTSLFIFMEKTFMPKGLILMTVRSVISARIISPLLIHFKRDPEAFFLPSLSNVEVLAFQLDKYISVTQQICQKMKEGFRGVLDSEVAHYWINGKPSLKLYLNMSEESVQELFDGLLQLTRIRMNESIRLTFIFGEKAQDFIDVFSERQSRMIQFLSDLDGAADQLDRMKKGSNIATVAGSSVGVVGGVLSIVGLALVPVTAGASLALTLTGVGLGVTSGVNGIVTGATEMAVNRHQGKKANDIFVRFMDDVQNILDCVEDVASREVPEARNLAASPGAGEVVHFVLQDGRAAGNITRLAAELPDVGQLAKGASVALSRSARVGLIAFNALFIGIDVFFICKDGRSLAKGSKNEVAQLIRSRSVLWRSEVEAWEKIHNLLFKRISGFDKYREILEKRFHF